MNDSRAANTEKAQTRRMAIAAGAVILICGSVFGGLFYLQRQAALSSTSREAQIEAFNKSVEPSKAQVAQRMANVRQLREQWRSWALQHKSELRRMLRASPNEHSALVTVYNQLPEFPKRSDAGFTGKEADDAGFTWQPGTKLDSNADFIALQAPEAQRNAGQMLAARARKHFSDIRDIELSRSFNRGFSHTSLWASGRVTEEYYRGNAGEKSMVAEIEPPYDFLK